MPAGRPCEYTPEIAIAVCLRIAEGESLRKVCSDENMPAKATILRWIGRFPEFRDQYAKAKVDGAEALAEELFEIADDGSNDWMEQLDKEGNAIGYRLNGEHVQRSKLRIDTRKWYLSKIMPKKYGDKIQQEHTGPDGGPIEVAQTLDVSGLPTEVLEAIMSAKDESERG